MLSYIYTAKYEDLSDAAEHDLDSDPPVQAIEPVIDVEPSSMNAATRISDDEPETTEGPAAADVDTATPSQKATGDLIEQALKNNVLVYAVADKYHIPLLKDLAQVKFTARARHVWPPAGLPGILRLVYETTPDNDQGLRMVVAELCTQHLPELISAKDFGDSLLALCPLSVDMLRTLCSTYVTERNAAAAEGQSLRAQVEDLQVKLKYANKSLADVKTIIQKTSNCRHCGDVFKPTFEDFETAKVPVVRCSGCRTRHYL
ncbi:MAG: hypothetical protein M1826_005201 [Phylliscum demangeonii]|nr:MAG: hypothetical protein M1826_005201 [Phylliscum demangeonii]